MGKKRPKTCEHGRLFEKVRSDENGPQRQSGLKRTRRRETAAEKKARLNFNAKVKARKCWFAWHRTCELCDGKGAIRGQLRGGTEPTVDATCPACEGDGKHRCTKPKDAHHLVPQRFTRKMFKAVLPEDQFVAILHNPLIGASLCRKAHDAIEAKQDRIYWEDLTPECIEYVGSLPDFVLIELERQCPKRPDPTPTTEESVAAPDSDLPLHNHNERSIDATSR